MRGARAALVALALVVTSSAFTVDCDKDYVDCEKELRKLADEFEVATDAAAGTTQKPENVTKSEVTTTSAPKLITTEIITPKLITPKIIPTPKARLLNLSAEDLQSENALNQSSVQKKSVDLSDVSLDDDIEFPLHSVREEPKMVVPPRPVDDKRIVFPLHKVENEDSRVVNKPILASAEDTHKQDDTLKFDGRESNERLFEESEEKCIENDISYKSGDKMERGCSESCECVGGGWVCGARCRPPFVTRGRRVADSLCYESPVDECCSIITCSNSDADSKASKAVEKKCKSNNSSYAVGEKWDEGCEKRCSCEANAVLNCKPRCEPLPTSEHCINVQDPHDSCCQMQVCDVTHDAHEHDDSHTTMEDRMDTDFDDLLLSTTSKAPAIKQFIEPVKAVTVLPNNTILLDLAHKNTSETPFHLQISNNGGFTLQNIALTGENTISGLEADAEYILKVKETGNTFDFKIPALEEKNDVHYEDKGEKTTENYMNVSSTEAEGCLSQGVMYKVGEEFRIGCSELCECVGPGQRECAALDCPSHVGLELISPTCIRWAPDPPDWAPKPPACCPTKMRCLSDGKCNYKGTVIPNWSEVPESLTGCEVRCFCESGSLDCQEVCAPLPPLPPQTLRCQHGFRPGAVNISDDDCCKQWGCVPIGTPPVPSNKPEFLPTIPPAIQFPADNDLNIFGLNRPIPPAGPQFPLPGLIPGGGDHIDNSKLTLRNLVSDTPTSLKILFEFSPVLVGLRGSVDLRYTDTDDEDISNWNSQVFAPTDEVLASAQLEFRLTGLKPSTEYHLRATLYLHNLPVQPVSSVYSVRTLDEPPLEEKRRIVEAGLRVQNVNATAATLSWRHFTEEQLQYIDGIQVRYRPLEQLIYSMTELLHHWRVSVELYDLRPGERYEASLVLVPPARSPVELYDPRVVNFTTPHYYDMYNFSVMLEARKVGSESVSVTWRGVPAPPERYVRVYRAAHSCDGSLNDAHRERDAFKLADRDQPPSILLNGLKPNSKCRVWLELFLTNGKVKISNVLDITTKTDDTSVDNEVQASSVTGSRAGSGDYYSALVGVGVVAALGTLASLLLLLVVMKRHRPHSVTISTVPSAPRAPSLPPYDNPAYKLELQQETMDL